MLVNGEKRDFEDGLSLAEVLDRLGIPVKKGIAVAVNDAVVPRARLSSYHPEDGDAIEIIRAVAGG